jgi:hypothetical protein
MVVALVALLVATGGTSYAVVRLPAGSVTSKQLKNGAVTRAKMKVNSVDASRVADNSLTGADISEATLTQIQSAARAALSDRATDSDHAAAAAALDKLSYRTGRGSAPAAATIDQHGIGTASAPCDAGQHVVGGGVKVDSPEAAGVIDSFADAGGTSWTGRIDNPNTAAPEAFTVYAICVPSVATG